MVDNEALFKVIAVQVGIVLGIYLILLLLLRMSNYFRITQCPACGGKLSRHKRNSKDKWLIIFALGMLPIKRYRCYACYWEGQAFEFKKEPKVKEVL